MTYRLEPGLGRIISPVVLMFPDGTKKQYKSGGKVIAAVFDRKWAVDSIRAKENIIEITLKETVQPDEPSFRYRTMKRYAKKVELMNEEKQK